MCHCKAPKIHFPWLLLGFCCLSGDFSNRQEVLTFQAPHQYLWIIPTNSQSVGKTPEKSYNMVCIRLPLNKWKHTALLALFSNCNWGWLWQIVLKYILKVKLNPNTHQNILSEILKLLENGGRGKNLVKFPNWHLYMGIAA